jgi:hypothetical protein
MSAGARAWAWAEPADTPAQLAALETNQRSLLLRAVITPTAAEIQELRDQVAWLTSRVEDTPPGQAIRDTMTDLAHTRRQVAALTTTHRVRTRP